MPRALIYVWLAATLVVALGAKIPKIKWYDGDNCGLSWSGACAAGGRSEDKEHVYLRLKVKDAKDPKVTITEDTVRAPYGRLADMHCSGRLASFRSKQRPTAKNTRCPSRSAKTSSQRIRHGMPRASSSLWYCFLCPAFAVTPILRRPARFSTPCRAGLLDRQTLGKQHAHMWDRLATDPKPLKGFISKYDASTSAH